MLSVFLGAGFSIAAGTPLASQLFDAKPEVDRITREQLVQRVLDGWNRWRAANTRSPEEYLAYLQANGGKAWVDAQWYIALTIALTMGRIEVVGGQPQVTRHNLDRTTGIASHERFWTTIFRRTQDVSVITTNYDILPERGIRSTPRPHVPRPGFHYGWGPEPLAGGGYPSYSHIHKITASGTVPIYKLHGSVSWSYRNSQLVRYHDCRPAIRGDAAIVAPVTSKVLPQYLMAVWKGAKDTLNASPVWLIIGYSLPDYDELVRNLLRDSAQDDLTVHVFDPDDKVVGRLSAILRSRSIKHHPGLPHGIDELETILNDIL